MCHSEDIGKEFVKAGVPHVIAVNNPYEVKDSLATKFARSFYESLLMNRTVKESFDRAVQVVRVGQEEEFEKRICL
eukprot:UN27394